MSARDPKPNTDPCPCCNLRATDFQLECLASIVSYIDARKRKPFSNTTIQGARAFLDQFKEGGAEIRAEEAAEEERAAEFLKVIFEEE